MGPLAVSRNESISTLPGPHSSRYMYKYSLPVSDDLRASRDGGGKLARAEVGTVAVAGEEGVGRVRERVVSVPFALDAGLSSWRVERHEAVADTIGEQS